MEFLSFDPSTKNLVLKKGKIPEPGSDEALVKVVYSGICGTDLHILEGNFPCKEGGSVTLGHEFCGTIISLGSGIKSFKVGQRVAIDPNGACNICNFCHNGKYNLCNEAKKEVIGIFRNGGWASHAVVPEKQLHLIPDDMEFSQAALAEPLSCVSNTLKILGSIDIGSRIVIMGAGIVGLLWATVLYLKGHRKTVTISELQEKRQEIAKNLALGYQVTSPKNLKSESFDLAIDCCGAGPAIESSISLLDRGGRLCIFGVSNPKTKVSISPFEIYNKEISIFGSKINPFTFNAALHLLRAMGKSLLKFDKLGIKVYKLSEYRKALDDLHNGLISKAMFDCTINSFNL